MHGKISLALTANAGLRISCRGLTLLLDSVYEDGIPPFADLPDGQWQTMLRAEAPFQQIGCLLVTHDHPDHFSARRLAELLAHRAVGRVVLPEQVAERYPELRRMLAERAIPGTILTEQAVGTAIPLSEGVTLRAWPTDHIDKAYRQVQHFCYELSVGDRHFLFTADMDYTPPHAAWLQRSFDAVCVNPLLFHELLRRNANVPFRAEQLLVYHIPPADGDTRLRTMTLRDAARCPQAILLDRPMEEILL